MSEKSKTVELTVSVSFPEGFSEKLTSLIRQRLLDFENAVMDVLPRRLGDLVVISSPQKEDKFSVACTVSLDDFDKKLQRALKCALGSLTSPQLTEHSHVPICDNDRCAQDES